MGSNICVRVVHTVLKFSSRVFSAFHCEWAIFCLISVKLASGMTKYSPMRLGRLNQMLDMRPCSTLVRIYWPQPSLGWFRCLNLRKPATKANFRDQRAPCVGCPWMGEITPRTVYTNSIVNFTIAVFLHGGRYNRATCCHVSRTAWETAIRIMVSSRLHRIGVL